MCRWYCSSTGLVTDLECLHCGTRYCAACLCGEAGKMEGFATCAHCRKPPRAQSSRRRKQWNCGPGSTMSRHGSAVSREDIMSTSTPLQLAFLCYASFGYPHVMEHMDGRMLQKWLRDADVFDRYFTRTDLDILFTKAVNHTLRSGAVRHRDHVRAGGLKRRLTYPQFLSIIPEIAYRKNWTESDVAVVLEKELPQADVSDSSSRRHADAMWLKDQTNRKSRQLFGLDRAKATDLSPVRSFRADSPARSFRAGSPVRSFRADSPVRSFRADSPARSFRADSPARSFRADSPARSVHAVSSTGHSQTASFSPICHNVMPTLCCEGFPRGDRAHDHQTSFAASRAAASPRGLPRSPRNFSPPAYSDHLTSTSDTDNDAILDGREEEADAGSRDTSEVESIRGRWMWWGASTTDGNAPRIGRVNALAPSTRESSSRFSAPPKISIFPSRCESCGRIRGHLAWCLFLGQLAS